MENLDWTQRDTAYVWYDCCEDRILDMPLASTNHVRTGDDWKRLFGRCSDPYYRYACHGPGYGHPSGSQGRSWSSATQSLSTPTIGRPWEQIRPGTPILTPWASAMQAHRSPTAPRPSADIDTNTSAAPPVVISDPLVGGGPLPVPQVQPVLAASKSLLLKSSTEKSGEICTTSPKPVIQEIPSGKAMSAISDSLSPATSVLLEQVWHQGAWAIRFRGLAFLPPRGVGMDVRAGRSTQRLKESSSGA